MALSKRAIGSGKWQKLRITVLDRDGWTCASCNRPAHTVDHIIPRVKGGDMWALDNLQSLCKPCNSRKGGRFFNSMPTPPVFSACFSPKTAVMTQSGPCLGQPEQGTA
jgi:5-methylcytosine-specific restriction endonuclease McrA